MFGLEELNALHIDLFHLPESLPIAILKPRIHLGRSYIHRDTKLFESIGQSDWCRLGHLTHSSVPSSKAAISSGWGSWPLNSLGSVLVIS